MQSQIATSFEAYKKYSSEYRKDFILGKGLIYELSFYNLDSDNQNEYNQDGDNEIKYFITLKYTENYK